MFLPLSGVLPLPILSFSYRNSLECFAFVRASRSRTIRGDLYGGFYPNLLSFHASGETLVAAEVSCTFAVHRRMVGWRRWWRRPFVTGNRSGSHHRRTTTRISAISKIVSEAPTEIAQRWLTGVLDRDMLCSHRTLLVLDQDTSRTRKVEAPIDNNHQFTAVGLPFS